MVGRGLKMDPRPPKRFIRPWKETSSSSNPPGKETAVNIEDVGMFELLWQIYLCLIHWSLYHYWRPINAGLVNWRSERQGGKNKGGSVWRRAPGEGERRDGGGGERWHHIAQLLASPPRLLCSTSRRGGTHFISFISLVKKRGWTRGEAENHIPTPWTTVSRTWRP